MAVTIWVAIISGWATIGAAFVAAWRTRIIAQAKAVSDQNAAALANRMFAMDYHQRTTAAAIADADRCREQLALASRELEAIYRDHPQLEDIYRERSHRE